MKKEGKGGRENDRCQIDGREGLGQGETDSQPDRD